MRTLRLVAALLFVGASGCYDTVEQHERDARRHEEAAREAAARHDRDTAQREVDRANQARRAAQHAYENDQFYDTVIPPTSRTAPAPTAPPVE